MAPPPDPLTPDVPIFSLCGRRRLRVRRATGDPRGCVVCIPCVGRGSRWWCVESTWWTGSLGSPDDLERVGGGEIGAGVGWARRGGLLDREARADRPSLHDGRTGESGRVERIFADPAEVYSRVRWTESAGLTSKAFLPVLYPLAVPTHPSCFWGGVARGSASGACRRREESWNVIIVSPGRDESSRGRFIGPRGRREPSGFFLSRSPKPGARSRPAKESWPLQSRKGLRYNRMPFVWLIIYGAPDSISSMFSSSVGESHLILAG